MKNWGGRGRGKRGVRGEYKAERSGGSVGGVRGADERGLGGKGKQAYIGQYDNDLKVLNT